MKGSRHFTRSTFQPNPTTHGHEHTLKLFLHFIGRKNLKLESCTTLKQQCQRLNSIWLSNKSVSVIPHEFVFSIHFHLRLFQHVSLNSSYYFPLMSSRSWTVFLALFLSPSNFNFLFSSLGHKYMSLHMSKSFQTILFHLLLNVTP